jgi:N,N-dimethylformamidase
MLDALESYLDGGGRAMYLGGNGLYWVTAIDPDTPHIVEVRRGQRGTGTWRSEEGESYLQSTGEPGGLWRERGRPPQRYVGVGMTAQGFDRSLPYVREAGSEDPRAAWIFDGVGDGPIGDYGLCLGGAAGFEIDRSDHALGTPPHALVLASARGFSDSYQHVVEEVGASNSLQGGSVEPRVRADMVFYETPNGGAVFSTGSITWCGSLSHAGYRNDVSRITDNVLRRFAADA